MKNKSIAILVYGSKDSGRNALEEDKYRDLAAAFVAQDYDVSSVSYSDDQAAEIPGTLRNFDMVLVWVNPVEQGHDRGKLDAVLGEVARAGCLVSTHPEVILKMGTKDILYTTRDMDWGGDTELYARFEMFRLSFPEKIRAAQTRVLKQYRGNGGNGVFKIQANADDGVFITHAISGADKQTVSWSGFFDAFQPFFSNGGMLIDQGWNDHMENGMVRCYVCGTRVAGFGYQEINALYEHRGQATKGFIPPSKRYYFTENCGLFRDLKEIMESKWIPELRLRLEIPEGNMPMIWDADFFINTINGDPASGKYTLCEINVSCVSPFPPSAVSFIVSETGRRLRN